MFEDNYLYVTIPYTGGQWTFTKAAEVSPTSTTTGTYQGYGDITDPEHEKYDLAAEVIVIDHRDNFDGAWAAINAPDNVKPREENPLWYTGTMETYLQYLKEHGVVFYTLPKHRSATETRIGG